MITIDNFTQCNFNVWFYDSNNHGYIYQKYNKNSKVTGCKYADKLKQNVLLIDGEPIKVNDVEEALTLINKKEGLIHASKKEEFKTELENSLENGFENDIEFMNKKQKKTTSPK